MTTVEAAPVVVTIVPHPWSRGRRWGWRCSCGESGGRNTTDVFAAEAAAAHIRDVHGQTMEGDD